MSYLASVCTRFHGEFTNPSPSPRFCQTFADDSPTASNISVGKVGGGGGGISPPLFLPFDRGCKISLPSNRGRVKGGIYEGKFQFRNSSLFLVSIEFVDHGQLIKESPVASLEIFPLKFLLRSGPRSQLGSIDFRYR